MKSLPVKLVDCGVVQSVIDATNLCPDTTDSLVLCCCVNGLVAGDETFVEASDNAVKPN